MVACVVVVVVCVVVVALPLPLQLPLPLLLLLSCSFAVALAAAAAAAQGRKLLATGISGQEPKISPTLSFSRCQVLSLPPSKILHQLSSLTLAVKGFAATLSSLCSYAELKKKHTAFGADGEYKFASL